MVLNRTAILEGRAPSSEAKERAGAIARAFADEVVNLLEVGPGEGSQVKAWTPSLKD